MIETGDYVNINFLGTPRYKKPVGIYWLQSLSVRSLNPHHLDEIWAYRVPSMIGATVAVLMTAALGALLFNSMTGLIAAVMLASCLDLNIEAHLAKTDASLLATVMVAQYALARAYLYGINPSARTHQSPSRLREGLGVGGELAPLRELNHLSNVTSHPSIPPASGREAVNAFMFWTALGLGILLKGPIILLTLFSTLLWLRVTEKNLSWFKRLQPLAGLPYLLVLIMPWFIAISLASHGQFAAQSGGHDFLAKIWQGQDRGFLPPGLHTLIFPVMFFPFSLFTLFAIPDAWKQRREQAVRFCIGWIIPTWIVFELSSTKLPHYVLPVYPAIALLTAKIFLDGFPTMAATTKRWLPTLAVSLWILIGMAFAIGMAALPYIVDHKINPVQIIGSGILLIAQGTGLLFFLQRRKLACVGMLVFGVVVFSGLAFSETLPNLQRLWVAREIVQEAKKYAPCPQLSLVSAGYQEPSLAFLAGTTTKLVPNGAYAAAEMQGNRCRVGVINAPLLREFLTSSSDSQLQPYPVGGTVEGVNTGHGSGTELYFYVMPQTPEKIPVYP